MIQARSALGASRQVFLATLGSFDTHTNQLNQQQTLLSELDAGLVAFHGAMADIGAGSSVTSFTLSDFSRNFLPNTGGGSDHAWGSHHMVIGDAVKGGLLYGTWPTLQLSGPDDATDLGRWIPTSRSINMRRRWPPGSEPTRRAGLCPSQPRGFHAEHHRFHLSRAICGECDASHGFWGVGMLSLVDVRGTVCEAPHRRAAAARQSPGLRMRASVPKSWLLLPLIFGCFVLFIPLSIMRSDPAVRLAFGPAETAQAQVISVSNASGCRNSGAHRVLYSFATQSGGLYRGSATVCEGSPYYALDEGNMAEVRYLKSDPAVNGLAGGGQNQAPPLAVFLFPPFIVLAVLGSMYWPALRDVLRARRLYRDGHLAAAKVVFVKQRALPYRQGFSGIGAAEVYLAYQTTQGARRESVAWCQNDWLIKQLTPGMTVHIAYRTTTQRTSRCWTLICASPGVPSKSGANKDHE